MLIGHDAPSTIAFRLPEGQLQDLQVSIENAPKLIVGKRYLLFFRQGPWSLTPYTNWDYSVFLIEKDRVFSLDGQCVAGFQDDFVQLGETLRYPEPIPGPIIGREQMYIQPTPDETDMSWLEVDHGNCLELNVLMHDLSIQVEEHHLHAPEFHDASFRDGGTLDFERPGLTTSGGEELMCKLEALGEPLCDETYVDGDLDE